MAIRYSGDVEVRVQWDPKARSFKGHVRGVARPMRSRSLGGHVPSRVLRWRGDVSGPKPSTDRLSDAYDRAAARLLANAERWALSTGYSFELEGEGQRVHVRRVFQAPCPIARRTERWGQRT